MPRGSVKTIGKAAAMCETSGDQVGMALGAVAGGAAAVLLAAKAAPLAVLNPSAAMHAAYTAFGVGVSQGAKLGVKASQSLR
ncbi:hypothetical protein ABZ348_06440 [Streptomyces sp. NPDC005963]|uniref:hypothetical protein n=1 Tax=Streptomyces sp. NPDC005963 TaxID=3156721 RepID=UPI0033E153B2